MKNIKEKNLKKIIPYYKKYWKLLILTVIFSLTYAGLSVLLPILEGNLLTAFTSLDYKYILKIAICLTMTGILIEIVINVWSRTVLKLNSNCNFDLKRSLLKSLTRIKVKHFDYTNSGVFIARINKDSNNLAELFDEVTDDISLILLNISFVFYSYFVNIYLGLALTINIIALYILISKKLIYLKKYQKDYKNKDDKCVGTYADIIRGIRDIKNLNIKDSIVKRASIEQKEAIEADKRAINFSRTWNRLRDIIQYIFDFIFVLISIYLLSINKLMLNQFMILFVYKKNIIQLIKSITNIREKVANAQVAADRVFGIIDYKEFNKEEFGDINIPSIKGTIEFKDVTFSYNNENELFNKINFFIEENKMIALVGKSGEGKSTIIDLIMKNYDINEGEIFIGDYDINKLTENTIRDNISVVSQEPYIFNLTIKDNIRLVNKQASDEEIIEVCKKAQIHDFIMSKKDGYDTYIGENGITLSGGQKQRLAIARALIKKSKIILLDEATSSLDNESQEKIKQIMKELSENHTVIIVAHRLSTIVDADKILVFNNHKIVEQGTHEELMKNSNIYKKLYEKDNIIQETIEN